MNFKGFSFVFARNHYYFFSKKGGTHRPLY